MHVASLPALAGPVVAAAALLVVAGAPKVARPADAVGALRSVGARVPAGAVRVLGAAETAVGALALIAGGRVAAALVAASYAGFTAFVVAALRAGGAVSSCGCVGREDTPPTPAHVVVTATLAVICGVAAIGSPDGVPAMVGDAPGTAVVVVGLAALIGWLCWLALAELPRLSPASWAPRRRPAG
jgi:hypothetical protein